MRKNLSSILLLVLVAILLNACGSGAQTSDPTVADDPVAKGQKLFNTTCAACHGPAGEGVTGLGKDMTASTFVAGLSDTELLDFIKTGRDASDPLNTTGIAMPPKGGNITLTDAQLLDIVAYMRSIHK